MSNNGNHHNPAIPFRSPAVPIVGQPFEVTSFLVTALLICKCGASPKPMLITSAGMTPCPSCGKGYTVQGITMAPGQGAAFKIGVVTPDAPQDSTRSSGEPSDV